MSTTDDIKSATNGKFQAEIILKIHWRLSMILKTSKEVYEDVIWYLKVYIFWWFIQYTIYWDKPQMLKKDSSDKINGTKNALFFHSQAPAHHSFTFNLLLERNVRLLEKICGNFHIRFCFSLQQENLKFSDICLSWTSPKTDLETNLENRIFENVSSSR